MWKALVVDMGALYHNCAAEEAPKGESDEIAARTS
jgi:hypothetical protein